MNILALDLSTKSTGYAIQQNGKLIKSGVIQNNSVDVIHRIYVMRDEVEKLLKEYNIEEVVAEEVPDIDRSYNTQQKLKWLQAAIVFVVYDYNPKIQLNLLQPSTWRSRIGIHTGGGIKRDELKKKDIEYVKMKYNLEVGDDEADAIGLLDAYLIEEFYTDINDDKGAW